MMRKSFSASLLLLLALAGWGPHEAPAVSLCTEPVALPGARNELRVGYAEIDITPRLEPWEDRNKNGEYDKGEKYEDRDGDGKWSRVWMAGFQPGRCATGIHDPLMARCLAVRTGDVTYMMISLDLVGLLYVRVRRIRKAIQEKTGVPDGHIVIACTHTHSGPDTIGLWGGLPGLSGVDDEYMKHLQDKVVEVAQDCVNSIVPSTMEAGAIRVTGLQKDTRPPKAINDTLTVLKFVEQGGKRKTRLLVNFGMHPEAAGRKNTMLSGDFVHYLCEALKPAETIFFNADLGGMITPNTKKGGWKDAEKIGKALARSTAMKKTSVSVTGLWYKLFHVQIPLENRTFIQAMQKRLFGDPEDTVKESGTQYYLLTEIKAFKLGDAMIVTVPGEAFPEIGRKILDLIGSKHKVLIGLGNDQIGYIVPKDSWNQKGYEESMSVGDQAEKILMENYEKMLKDF